ncbi:MAG: hypothetical protein WA323_19955 [Candidatus Nitrosopolaris sp.]
MVDLVSIVSINRFYYEAKSNVTAAIATTLLVSRVIGDSKQLCQLGIVNFMHRNKFDE